MGVDSKSKSIPKKILGRNPVRRVAWETQELGGKRGGGKMVEFFVGRTRTSKRDHKNSRGGDTELTWTQGKGQTPTSTEGFRRTAAIKKKRN